MNIRRIITAVFYLSVAGCANQTSPTGGPTDKTPPELVTSSPRNNEKNFTGANLQFTFNEDIKLKNPKEEIIITPSVGNKTKFTAKGKKLLIEPELPWQENTTYSISLREGVQDITEGNPTENIQLAFSTGSIIDSLRISGTVSPTFGEKIPDRVTVALYQRDTFDIFTHTPTYFTFTDKTGKYSITNLKAGTYFVYAFEDKNKNLKVESKSEKFSFLKKSFDPSDTVEANLQLIKVDARPLKFTTVRHSEKITSVRFNKEFDSLILDRKKSELVYRIGSSKNELFIHHNIARGDSMSISLGAIDSTQQRIDTTLYIKNVNQKLIDEAFKISPIRSEHEFATKKYHGSFLTNKLIKELNFDSIYIQLDTTKRIRFLKEEFRYDTLNNKLYLSCDLTDTLTKKSKPVLKFGKGAFISATQDSTKLISTSIRYKSPDETGTLIIQVTTREQFYIIQLLKDEKLELETRSTQKSLTFQYLEPGTYKIRIIVDSNNNGKWDAGNFENRIEPEKVLYYKNTEGLSSIPTRANWEVGPLMIKF